MAAVLMAVGAIAVWGYVLSRRRVRGADAVRSRWSWGMLLIRLLGVALAGFASFLEMPTLAVWGIGLAGGSLVLGMLVDLFREQSARVRLQSFASTASVAAFFGGLLAKVPWLLWIGVVGIGFSLLHALLTLLIQRRPQTD